MNEHAQATTAAAALFAAVPTLLWVCLIAGVLYWLREEISELFEHLLTRVRSGVAISIKGIEIGAITTEQLHNIQPIDSSSSGSREGEQEEEEEAPEAPEDRYPSNEARELGRAREAYRRSVRRIMLVHRLFRSTKPGQVYDVLIYLIPHKQGTLVEVSGVEYFFGRYWKNEVFRSDDRSRGYPVLTSAYGTFLCCARITFNDGRRQVLFRYIDFEMGAYAPLLESAKPGKKPPAAVQKDDDKEEGESEEEE